VLFLFAQSSYCPVQASFAPPRKKRTSHQLRKNFLLLSLPSRAYFKYYDLGCLTNLSEEFHICPAYQTAGQEVKRSWREVLFFFMGVQNLLELDNNLILPHLREGQV
jgi:hypothetical protein